MGALVASWVVLGALAASWVVLGALVASWVVLGALVVENNRRTNVAKLWLFALPSNVSDIIPES